MEKIQPIVREAGVDRSSICFCKDRALVSLRAALQPCKRGPKFKKNPRHKEIEEKLKEKVAKLENSLEEKGREIKRLKERLGQSKEKARSVERPYCGFERVCKNDTYKRKSKGFFDRLKQDREKEETVQVYVSPWWGKCFQLGKKVFFHTHTEQQLRRAIGIFRTDGKMYLRCFKDCFSKLLYVDVCLGFIYTEVKRVVVLARRINSKVRFLVNVSHCTIDEVWTKLTKTAQRWNFGLLTVS